MVTREYKDNIWYFYGEKREVLFTMQENMQESQINIVVTGQIKGEAAWDFEDELIAAALTCQKVALNFEKLQYLSSIGLAALLKGQQIIDDKENEEAYLKIEKVSSEVMETLQSTGFIDLLWIV